MITSLHPQDPEQNFTPIHHSDIGLTSEPDTVVKSLQIIEEKNSKISFDAVTELVKKLFQTYKQPEDYENEKEFICSAEFLLENFTETNLENYLEANEKFYGYKTNTLLLVDEFQIGFSIMVDESVENTRKECFFIELNDKLEENFEKNKENIGYVNDKLLEVYKQSLTKENYEKPEIVKNEKSESAPNPDLHTIEVPKDLVEDLSQNTENLEENNEKPIPDNSELQTIEVPKDLVEDLSQVSENPEENNEKPIPDNAELQTIEVPKDLVEDLSQVSENLEENNKKPEIADNEKTELSSNPDLQTIEVPKDLVKDKRQVSENPEENNEKPIPDNAELQTIEVTKDLVEDLSQVSENPEENNEKPIPDNAELQTIEVPKDLVEDLSQVSENLEENNKKPEIADNEKTELSSNPDLQTIEVPKDLVEDLSQVSENLEENNEKPEIVKNENIELTSNPELQAIEVPKDLIEDLREFSENPEENNENSIPGNAELQKTEVPKDLRQVIENPEENTEKPEIVKNEKIELTPNPELQTIEVQTHLFEDYKEDNKNPEVFDAINENHNDLKKPDEFKSSSNLIKTDENPTNEVNLSNKDYSELNLNNSLCVSSVLNCESEFEFYKSSTIIVPLNKPSTVSDFEDLKNLRQTVEASEFCLLSNSIQTSIYEPKSISKLEEVQSESEDDFELI